MRARERSASRGRLAGVTSAATTDAAPARSSWFPRTTLTRMQATSSVTYTASAAVQTGVPRASDCSAALPAAARIGNLGLGAVEPGADLQAKLDFVAPERPEGGFGELAPTGSRAPSRPRSRARSGSMASARLGAHGPAVSASGCDPRRVRATVGEGEGRPGQSVPAPQASASIAAAGTRGRVLRLQSAETMSLAAASAARRGDVDLVVFTSKVIASAGSKTSQRATRRASWISSTSRMSRLCSLTPTTSTSCSVIR